MFSHRKKNVQIGIHAFIVFYTGTKQQKKFKIHTELENWLDNILAHKNMFYSSYFGKK